MLGIIRTLVGLSVVLFYINDIFAIEPQLADQQEIKPKLLIDISDGGSESPRNLNRLADYLAERNCNLQIETFLKDNQANLASQLQQSHLLMVFKPIADSSFNSADFKLFLQVKSLLESQISGAIVVRENTIDSPEGLKGETVAIVGTQSQTGFLMQKMELSQLDLSISENKLLTAGNHMGALSLLLHRDAFAAFIENGFAEQWKLKNNLVVINTSKAKKVGGIFVNRQLQPDDQNALMACRSAILSLNRANKKMERLMQVFPDWLVAFED